MMNGNSGTEQYKIVPMSQRKECGRDIETMWLRRRALMCRTIVAGLFCCLSLGSLCAAPADSQFRSGLSAYKGGDFEKALHIWLPLAQREDAPSQAGLG